MPSMASHHEMDTDARRNGMQRLLLALAICCSLSVSAHAQPAAAVPPEVRASEPTVATPSEPASGAQDSGTLASQNNPEQTVAAGQRFVTQTEREFGKNSRQSAEAYTDLAEAQRSARQHDAAEKNYLTAIEIYRSIDGPFSPLVIQPLTALGDNYQESGDYLKAVSAYGEARTVSRRTYGLLNEAQIPFLDRSAQALLELNQPVEADEQQLEALRIIERNHPPESDEALEGVYKYAEWLRENGRFQEERDQYGRALRTIRDVYGKEDARQVKPLLGIGNSFRNQRIPEGQGSGALRDALSLLLAQKDPDELTVAEVLRDLGDWEVAFSKVDYDGAEYRRAWQLLGEVASGDEIREEWFTGPNYVLREPISLRGLSQEPTAPPGHVLVRFDLDKAGHSLNAAVVESDPPGLKDEAVLRHIRRSRFRPQMANGELVPRDALALQFNYRYTPGAVSELEDGKAAND
jgi:tetratricopeptide (TPR) repeat protein